MFDPGTSPSKPVSSARLADLLARFELVMDLNIPGLELDGMLIENRTFHGCNFTRSRLYNCRIRDCEFEMCFFDFSSHANAEYSGLTARNCVFACSSFENVSFTGCNLIQCNFNAVSGDLAFDDCDLLHSRFDGALGHVTVKNCNLKETHFLRTTAELLSFKYSNEEDAVFVDPDGW